MRRNYNYKDIMNQTAEIRETVANSIATPLNTLIELMDDSDEAVASAAYSNIVTCQFAAARYSSSTPASVLAALAKTRSVYSKRAAADHPNTDPATLAYLAKSKDWHTQAAVARNPNTPPEALDKLARGDSRSIVAMNPATSEKTLNFIADTTFKCSRTAVQPKETP